MNDLLPGLLDIVKKAEKDILEVYNNADLKVEYKGDESPLTEADKRSNDTILKGLEDLTPGIPVISEESKDVPYERRENWKKFWLVDPLDGTKEFISRNGEFTINLALIEGKKPVFGIISAPAMGLVSYGGRSMGAFCSRGPGKSMQRIRAERSPSLKDRPVAAVSRSHLSRETEMIVDKLDAETKTSGSSVKFVLVARGEADFYPRFGPTWEWDTGAGEAIAEAAGASVLGLNGEPLSYNKKVPKHEGFIVSLPGIKQKLLGEVKSFL